jgi:hypothetical protein
MHFWGEFRAESNYVDVVLNTAPMVVTYSVPNSDPAAPPIYIKLTYPRQIVTGEQNFVTYEIKNYDQHDPLQFDPHLVSSGGILLPQVIFNASSMTTTKKIFVVDTDKNISLLEFQPQVKYMGSDYQYTTVRQIQVHSTENVRSERLWKWLDLILLIISSLLWLALLIFI